MQFILLVMLFMQLESLDERLVSALQLDKHDPLGATVALSPQPADSIGERTATDYHELRRIVRDEIHAAQSRDTTFSAPQHSELPLIDETELQYRWDLAVEELEFLKGREEVTTAELNNLVGLIAQLDSKRRTELMKRLNQALNRGEIKGTL